MQHEPERRASVLTDEDIERIVSLLSKHTCRYDITHAEMDEMRSIIGVLRQMKKKVIDTITMGIIMLAVGLIWLLFGHEYFKGIGK